MIEIREDCSKAMVGPASALLRSVWKPPSILYSREYVNWQLGFRSRPEPVVIGAFRGSELCGLTALVPRSLRVGGVRLGVWVLTFVAVSTRDRGQGLSTRLYEHALGRAMDLGVGVLVFVAPSSASERALESAAARLGMPHRALEPCRTYACAVAPQAHAGAADPISAAEFGQFIDRCASDDVLTHDADRAQLDHYARDPRGRAIVAIHREQGEPIAVAMLVRGEVTGASKTDRLALLDAVIHAPDADPSDTLPVVANHASRIWAGQMTSAVLVAPSIATVAPAALRAAGLRATPSIYRPHTLAPTADSPLLQAKRTTVEVI